MDDLAEYNRTASKPLKPIVCIADEANDLLEIEAVETAMQILARRGRKAGIWIVLAAQEWKVSAIDARIRRQTFGDQGSKKHGQDHTNKPLLRRPNSWCVNSRGASTPLCERRF